MKPNQTYDIAIIFPAWYPYLNDIVEGILEIRGIRQHCRFRNFISKNFNEPVNFPSNYQPDGILISYDAENFDASWLKNYNVPIVNIFSALKTDFPTVGICPQSLGKLVVKHFVALGFRAIAVLGTTNITYLSKVYQTITEECEQRSIPHWYLEIPDGIDAGCWAQLEKHAPELKDKLLNSKIRTGIYTSHDMRGRLLVDYCTELGVKVPEDIGILGRFDSINARLSTPELSSIVMPGKQIGATAIQLLVNLIDGQKDADLNPLIKVTEVRVRQSTIRENSPNMIALQARTMIREQACAGLTVDEIVQALPVARSTFEKRYLALTGSTPAQEIRDTRIKKAKELLLASNKPIEEIAKKVGFLDSRPFVVFFKREVKQTPGDFRMNNKP